MHKVTLIVTLTIFIAYFGVAEANQAYFAGTENVIDLKKIEIPYLKEMLLAAESEKSNGFFGVEFLREIQLNNQKIKVFHLTRRPLWHRLKYPLPWVVSVGEQGKVIEINGAALVNHAVQRVDFILDN